MFKFIRNRETCLGYNYKSKYKNGLTLGNNSSMATQISTSPPPHYTVCKYLKKDRSKG